MTTPLLTLALIQILSSPAHAAKPSTLNAFAEGERVVYARVVEFYHKDALAETIRERDLLAKNYPNSLQLDNAYYLTGVLEYQKNNLAEAVRDFGTVIDRFPHSHKRPAALFAKASTYEKLMLKPLSERLFNQIIREYPGSQESQRAWMQLRIASVKPPKK